jgi:hypothetical protein
VSLVVREVRMVGDRWSKSSEHCHQLEQRIAAILVTDNIPVYHLQNYMRVWNLHKGTEFWNTVDPVLMKHRLIRTRHLRIEVAASPSSNCGSSYPFQNRAELHCKEIENEKYSE